MKRCRFYWLMSACILVAGCTKHVRSISHSGYPQQSSYCGNRIADGMSDPAFEYRGELSEFDVLGIPRGEITSEAEIRRALEGSKSVKPRPGSTILLIQSGALFPDSPMVTELSKSFHVVPFSGVPTVRRIGAGNLQTESSDPESYSKALRLTAARGGADCIVCYWACWNRKAIDCQPKPCPGCQWFIGLCPMKNSTCGFG
jgi:hypothetical protein